MAVVYSNYRFVYIDEGAYDKECDSSVFQRTNFYRMLTDGRLDVSGNTFVDLHYSYRPGETNKRELRQESLQCIVGPTCRKTAYVPDRGVVASY